MDKFETQHQKSGSSLDPNKSHSSIEVFLDSPVEGIVKGIEIVTTFTLKVLGKFAINKGSAD